MARQTGAALPNRSEAASHERREVFRPGPRAPAHFQLQSSGGKVLVCFDGYLMPRQVYIDKCLLKAVLAVALALAGVTLACSTNSPQNPQAGAPPGMPVKVLEARAVPISDSTEYVATLKSRDSTVIMPQVEGQITQIFVHSGDRVEASAPLMEI